MAVVCPSCEHIHFPAPGTDPPRECGRCGVDLRNPPVRPTAVRPDPTPAKSGVHLPTVLAGIVVAFGGVCAALVGKQKLDQYETATVTVRVAKVVDKVNDLNLGAYGGVRYTHFRFDTTAMYVANGKAYPYKLEASATKWDWADGEKFDIYYHVEDPGTPVKSRPMGVLLSGAAAAVIGLAVLGFAVFVGNGGELPAAYCRPGRA